MRTSSRPSVCRARPTFSVGVRIRVARKSLSQLSANHPEEALRRIEGKATADGEGLHDFVRAEGRLAEHAGPVHGGRGRSSSGEFNGYHVCASDPVTATGRRIMTVEGRASRVGLPGKGVKGPGGPDRQRAGVLQLWSKGVHRVLPSHAPRRAPEGEEAGDRVRVR